MLCVIARQLSAISTNVLEIRLPITIIYPFTDSQFHHKYPVTIFDNDFRECSQNSHGPPCGIIFMSFVTHFSELYWLPHGDWWLFLVNFGNLLKTRAAV